mgnify:FL=1
MDYFKTLAEFISSDEGRQFYKDHYEVRLSQWIDDSFSESMAESNARAEALRDCERQSKALTGADESPLMFDDLQDQLVEGFEDGDYDSILELLKAIER